MEQHARPDDDGPDERRGTVRTRARETEGDSDGRSCQYCGRPTGKPYSTRCWDCRHGFTPGVQLPRSGGRLGRAEREARILAHQARVQAELARLEEESGE